MGRNKKGLKFQLINKLDSLNRIGTSKHDQQVKNAALGLGYKSEYIHSIRTMELYKDDVSRFVLFLKDNNYDFKNISDISRNAVKQYVMSRNDKSAWTSHVSLAAMNKLFNYNLTTAECCLKTRQVTQIHNNRNETAHRELDKLRNSEQIKLIQACGCRRSSVTKINYNSCIFNSSGKVESIRCKEKGGKLNTYYVLPAYQDWLTSKIVTLVATPEKSLFTEFDANKHVNSHYYRNEYSCNLYNQLKDELNNEKGFYNDSQYMYYAINPTKVSENLRRYGENYKGYDTMLLSMLSQSLGHYRLDVCVNHYLRF